MRGLNCAPVLLFFIAAHALAVVGTDGEWEPFADRSTGQVTIFRGAGGVSIPAYVRKPSGAGPFPVIVNLHGGNASPESTYASGRSTRPPISDWVAAGWAIYTIDFRPDAPLDPIEWRDTIAAIETARRLPFIENTINRFECRRHFLFSPLRVLARF